MQSNVRPETMERITTKELADALAEILDVFPIFSRRLKIQKYMLEGLLFVMALGKMAGSLFYFFAGYGILGG